MTLDDIIRIMQKDVEEHRATSVNSIMLASVRQRLNYSVENYKEEITRIVDNTNTEDAVPRKKRRLVIE